MNNSTLTILPNKWLDYSYDLNNQILSNQHITKSLSNLHELLLNSNVLTENSVILIQFKIKIDIKTIRSISYIQTVTLSKKDLSDLNEIFIEFWNLREED